MLGGFVDRDRLIVMCPTFRKGPRTHQRRTHKTMPKHERNHCSPLLGKRQALCRKVEESVAVEPYIVRDPETIEKGKQQHRMFGGLSELLRLLDEGAGSIERCDSLRGRVAFGVHQRIHKRELQFDLVATQRWCARQRRNL